MRAASGAGHLGQSGSVCRVITWLRKEDGHEPRGADAEVQVRPPVGVGRDGESELVTADTGHSRDDIGCPARPSVRPRGWHEGQLHAYYPWTPITEIQMEMAESAAIPL